MTSTHDEPRTYEVRHRTSYHYGSDVTGSYGRARLRPRDGAGQRVRSTRVGVTPEPDLTRPHTDFFGNVADYFEVSTRHTDLIVEAISVVEVDRPRVDPSVLDTWTVEQAAAATQHADPIDASVFRLPSRLVEVTAGVARYAEQILTPTLPLGEALTAITHRIHTEFAYEQGATSVTTSLDEVLASRAGVCQDFAHLAAGCLRHVGLSARYVSGYLETSPPPGKPKLEGSDASHAWCSVLAPDGRWVDLDPTNDHFADCRYVVTAWGRDYKDVTPLKGVIFTEGRGSRMEVAVDVRRLGATVGS